MRYKYFRFGNTFAILKHGFHGIATSLVWKQQVMIFSKIRCMLSEKDSEKRILNLQIDTDAKLIMILK